MINGCISVGVLSVFQCTKTDLDCAKYDNSVKSTIFSPSFNVKKYHSRWEVIVCEKKNIVLSAFVREYWRN